MIKLFFSLHKQLLLITINILTTTHDLINFTSLINKNEKISNLFVKVFEKISLANKKIKINNNWLKKKIGNIIRHIIILI